MWGKIWGENLADCKNTKNQIALNLCKLLSSNKKKTLTEFLYKTTFLK